MPWNVGGQAGRFGGGKGAVPEITVPKSPGTTGHPLPGTASPFGLAKSQGQGVKETESQVLPFPQLVPEQLPTKRNISVRPGSQFRGLPPFCYTRPKVRMRASEGTEKGPGPFTYHWPYRPISREGIGP